MTDPSDTHFAAPPIWMLIAVAPLGITVILVQAVLSICRVRNKGLIMLCSPIYVFFLVFLMLTCGYMLNCIASVYFRRPEPPDTPIIIMFVGVLIIAVFEGLGLIILVMLMQWNWDSTAPMATEDGTNSSRPSYIASVN